MSSVNIPRALSQRGRSSMDVERENFEKTQLTSLQKAINATETPVKEKHVRRAIMGSHQERGASLFWSVVLRFQLQGNPIVCWKFCNVLHKMLRDGHANSVPESYRYCGFLTDLGKLWGHLKDHHGRLISHYTKLLVQKLSFHKKYPPIPGNLVLDDEGITNLCNNDINTYFEMCVDMLDYMDDILALQAAVFGSLDMSRANSMTAVGQCRLSPLIPCIQDSCQLYDSIVKVLFKLHSSLPPDTLTGHRDRFYKQYKNLKRFYFNSGNLQYFKNLIRVPTLPDEPPNFLIASELSSHVKPEAVIEEPEPEPEPEPEEAPVDLLVDTQAAPQQNGAPSPPMPDEKDIMIQQLMAEVTRLRDEVSHLRGEEQMMSESLHNRIRELEMEINELKQIAQSTQEENEDLRTALKDGEKNQDAAGRLAVMEKIATSNEDKFKKIKDMYTRIKKEHVELLRSHAEVNKKLAMEKKEREDTLEEKQTLAQQLEEISHEKSKVETTFQQSSAENSAELAAVNNLREQLAQQKQALEAQLEEVTSQKEQTQSEYQDVQQKQEEALTKIQSLQSEVERLQTDKESVDQSLKSESEQHKDAMCKIQSLEGQLQDTTAKKEASEAECRDLQEKQQLASHKIDELETELDSVKTAKGETEAAHTDTQSLHQQALDKIQMLEKQLTEVTEEREVSRAECKDLRHERDSANSSIKDLEVALKAMSQAKDVSDTDIESLQQKYQKSLFDNKSLTSHLEETVEERDSARSECSRLTEQRRQCEETIQGLEAELSTTKTEKEQTESTLTALATSHQGSLISIASLDSKLQDTTKELEQSHTECSNVKQKHDEACQKIQSLESKVQKVEDEKSSVQTSYSDIQAKYHDALNNIQQLTADLTSSRTKESTLTSDLQNMTKASDESKSKNKDLESQLSALEAARAALQASLDQSQASLDHTKQDLDQSRTDKDKMEKILKEDLQNYKKKMLLSAVEEGEVIIREAMSQTDNPHLSTITCTAEYLMDRVNPVLQSITLLRDSVQSYSQDQEVEGLVKSICDFSHRMGEAIVMGYATAQVAPIEEGEGLSADCRDSGEAALNMLDTVKKESFDKVPSEAEKVCEMVRRILERAEALLPKVEDIKAEQMGDMVDQEMQQTTDAISKAAEKIATMLAQSREKYTGIQLEVNERILDSCNGLMRAIMKLVEKSKNLQREIVSQGRGASSAKEFYKKHHRWTEGLISAAKAVGWGANVLVEAADKAVKGEGKFEELMVCSQEIAASTTQLVVSSKVKANRGSENLKALAEASKGVTENTGRVVASAKSGADAAEEIDAMDFSKLTLHQSKRLEMESQVKVITLESDLEKERVKLSELRKTHYRLAGESEGWEQENS